MNVAVDALHVFFFRPPSEMEFSAYQQPNAQMKLSITVLLQILWVQAQRGQFFMSAVGHQPLKKFLLSVHC